MKTLQQITINNDSILNPLGKDISNFYLIANWLSTMLTHNLKHEHFKKWMIISQCRL